jgi:hypothetical protein
VDSTQHVPVVVGLGPGPTRLQALDRSRSAESADALPPVAALGLGRELRQHPHQAVRDRLAAGVGGGLTMSMTASTATARRVEDGRWADWPPMVSRRRRVSGFRALMSRAVRRRKASASAPVVFFSSAAICRR